MMNQRKDSRSSKCPADNHDRKRKMESNETNENSSSRTSKEMKVLSQTIHQTADLGTTSGADGIKSQKSRRLQRKDIEENNATDDTSSSQEMEVDHPTSKTKRNEPSIKNFLEGVSYQIGLIIINCLLAYKWSMNFTTSEISADFCVNVECIDNTSDKFDDIVISFQYGDKNGKLKIQAKSHSKPLKLIDFINKRKANNQFTLPKYIASYLDSEERSSGKQILMIITNANMANDENLQRMWKTLQPALTGGKSPRFLDSYVSTLCKCIGGTCYQLAFDQLRTMDGMFIELQQLFREGSNRVRLARLLVENIKSNGKIKITRRDHLFKEYRSAILHIIRAVKKQGKKTCYRFTREFLDSSSTSNSLPGYEAFRNEFKDQYQQEFSVNGSVWKNLEKKQVYVANAFMKDKSDESLSGASFPDDKINKSLKSFCKRFRVLCGTKSKIELDNEIVKLWGEINRSEHHSLLTESGRGEYNAMLNHLFIETFCWLKDSSDKTWSSKFFKRILDNIKNTSAFVRLTGISSKLRMNYVKSQFEIKRDALETSPLYQYKGNVLEMETRDVKFGATVLFNIAAMRVTNHLNILFLEEVDIMNDPKTVESVFHFIDQSCALIVICKETFQQVKDIVQYWNCDSSEGVKKQVFLICETSNILSDSNGFRICDLTDASRKQFLDKSIPLCTTTILPSKIFQNIFRDPLIEEVIEMLNWGEKMEENNKILKKYRKIESTYVHCSWIDEKIEIPSQCISWTKNSPVLRSIKSQNRKIISFKNIIKSLKKDPNSSKIFGKIKKPRENQPNQAIVGDANKKVLILLGEAGIGKSTNLTWLAWHLRQQNPLSWVVRCNLSDHCSDFNKFLQDQNNEAGKVIDETEAMKMLYTLVYSSLQFKPEMGEACSKWIVFSHGSAILNVELMKKHRLSINDSIQLVVFKEKFNAGELMLLLDGFDEIAPHYKEVVLKFLSHFEQFKGLKKLYLTSRPYGFNDQLRNSFKDSSLFKLKPLSLQEKRTMMYKMMKKKWRIRNIEDGKVSVSYQSLCGMLLCSLGDMSNIPLYLMISVDVLADRVYHNQGLGLNFSSKTINIKLLDAILDLSKASFTVEEFVKVKIRRRLYDKNKTDGKVIYKPSETDNFGEEIEKVKLLHGLVALLLLFDKSKHAVFLSANELRQAEVYMKKIKDGNEKTGIVYCPHDGVFRFIHRTFVEYLAAWWIVKRRIQEKQQGMVKIFCLESFWDQGRKELRVQIDTILAKHHKLHLAIIERDWETVVSLLSDKPEALYEKDDGNRTALHLIALHHDFEKDWPSFLPCSIETNILNTKEKFFGWTALDVAFHRDNPRLVYYLLHHGASINVNVLYEQVVSGGNNSIRKGAKYARYVMQYLSRQVVACNSHVACGNMKQLCDKVIAYMAKETPSIRFRRLFDPDDNKCIEKTILKDIIFYDSVWMLESVIHQEANEEHFFEMIRNSYLQFAIENNSILVVKYFMANDPSILPDEFLWKCAVYSALNDYKIEFKYFVDLYCSRFKIKDFESCPIQSDDACYLESDCLDNKVKHLVCNFRNSIRWTKLGIPTVVMIDENILSLLVICVATGRQCMLKYLKASCKLNLCAGLLYWLAMLTNHLFSKIHREVPIKPSKAYAYLLDLASNISDMDATNILRLAITSNLFAFSKCLIERYDIQALAVDEFNGWNVYHLCASNQRSFWIEEMTSGDYDSSYVDGNKTDLFHYLLEKRREKDCLRVCNKKERRILHMAMQNGLSGIVKYILERRLGLHDNNIENLSVDDLPNIKFCYREIREITKSIGKEQWHCMVFCMLNRHIAKIALTIDAQSITPNRARLLLQKDAKKLYEIAMEGRSLFLMYYLHREFPSAIPPPIYDANWLACTARSLYSPYFLAVTKWMLNPNAVDQHANLYEDVDECDAQGYDLNSVNLVELVNQVEAILSTNRSMEEICKLKLLAVGVCMKNESIIRHLCETLKLNIDWKVLIDIMVIAHRSHNYQRGTKYIQTCAFTWSDFDPIYKYLFERTSNFGKIDAEGANVLHLAVQNGLGCMANFLIKHNVVNVMTTNEQNGWNIFHYYASIKSYWKCIKMGNDTLLSCITKRALEITSADFPLVSLTESRKNKLKELCFSSNERRKSAIHVAVETGNIGTAEYIIQTRLGFGLIDKHEIRNSDECSRYRECYDELCQIGAQLPFSVRYDYLSHRLTKSIHRFSSENIEHITEQGNVEDHIVEDACRSAIKYRSVTSLVHLMNAYEGQMNKALRKISNNELLASMTECIRRNNISMFKVLVRNYPTSQDFLPRGEMEFENDENDNINTATIDEQNMQWQFINKFSKDVTMNRDCQHLLILSVAYGRHLMARYLVQMLQLEVNKSLILSIMQTLSEMKNQICKAAVPVYEYLASKSEGKCNLLHLSAQAGCWTMVKYLIEEENYNPNEINSENGWNAGHYCVSEPVSGANSMNAFDVFKLLMHKNNINCCDVLDRNGRSVLYLALENGHTCIVKYIINDKLHINTYTSSLIEWNLIKLEEQINELQQIMKRLPENIPKPKQRVIQEIFEKLRDRKIAISTYNKLYTKPS